MPIIYITVCFFICLCYLSVYLLISNIYSFICLVIKLCVYVCFSSLLIYLSMFAPKNVSQKTALAFRPACRQLCFSRVRQTRNKLRILWYVSIQTETFFDNYKSSHLHVEAMTCMKNQVIETSNPIFLDKNLRQFNVFQTFATSSCRLVIGLACQKNTWTCPAGPCPSIYQHHASDMTRVNHWVACNAGKIWWGLWMVSEDVWFNL